MRTITLTQPGQKIITTAFKGATTPYTNQLSQIRDAGNKMSGKWVIKGPQGQIVEESIDPFAKLNPRARKVLENVEK